MIFEVGVDAVSVDEEKKLVYVKGRVDPWLMIKAIEEIGNTAELLSYEKQPKKTHSSNTTETDQINTTTTTTSSIKNNGKEKKTQSFPFSKGKKQSKKKEKKQEEEHKIEDYDYDVLKIDPEICRDPYCKQHKLRSTITSLVPSRDDENHPHHSRMGFVPGAHQLFDEMPYQPLQQYYYNYPPPMMAMAAAPPGYGGFLHSTRHTPHGFTFYRNGNPRECTMM
ncbi:hypothetical protein M9H77_28639 [Catharanthus roseus]|uniref:Uncharacterized protein n=1 Tax=Catharanthus roseus TaxID=4058 RepID=A0ACC0AGI7_CATRO|nr:hypothetical protein M9H77_28639 [Catharanthus roseus]